MSGPKQLTARRFPKGTHTYRCISKMSKDLLEKPDLDVIELELKYSSVPPVTSPYLEAC